jgi:hypothetical protein
MAVSAIRVAVIGCRIRDVWLIEWSMPEQKGEGWLAEPKLTIRRRARVSDHANALLLENLAFLDHPELEQPFGVPSPLGGPDLT